ncbi:MAG: hypothetical protein Q4B47_06685 [Eubacteriales bacterium]|nr:hypothetical protein [Eubacteriales bacterium]
MAMPGKGIAILWFLLIYALSLRRNSYGILIFLSDKISDEIVSIPSSLHCICPKSGITTSQGYTAIG